MEYFRLLLWVETRFLVLQRLCFSFSRTVIQFVIVAGQPKRRASESLC